MKNGVMGNNGSKLPKRRFCGRFADCGQFELLYGFHETVAEMSKGCRNKQSFDAEA
jgi:hypothetical protein